MITFVGAGSGAEDLITVRGARLLQEADVIVYAGSLVNPALLDRCPSAYWRSLPLRCDPGTDGRIEKGAYFL